MTGLKESFPYALQVGLEEMLGKERRSSLVPWMEVVGSLGCGNKGSLPAHPVEQPSP